VCGILPSCHLHFLHSRSFYVLNFIMGFLPELIFQVSFGFSRARKRHMSLSRIVSVLSVFNVLTVPCRRFAAHKTFLNGIEKVSFRQNYRPPFLPTVPPFATRSARVVGDVEASGGKRGNV
jgi:hypothetical protein